MRLRGHVSGREIEIRRSDEARRWLLVEAATLRYEGRQATIVGGNDITERKALELKLLELATVDSLTGLANRRHFMERARHEYARARRSGKPLAAMMIDIDRFKEINDRHGHAVGDRVIRRLAESLRAITRTTDIAGRLGGDEFAVILPETDRIAAHEVAGRVLAAVLAERVESGTEAETAGESAAIAASISIGVALLRDGDASPDALLNRADAALYEAKRRGRNQVSDDGGGNSRQGEDVD